MACCAETENRACVALVVGARTRLPAPTGQLVLARSETPFLRRFYLKCIILPRQARDKHKENSKKMAFPVGGLGAATLGCVALAAGLVLLANHWGWNFGLVAFTSVLLV